MSTKIKTEINKISKKIEIEILKYQNLRSNSESMTSMFPEVTFNDIVNHSSNFWKSFDLTIEEDTDIPRIIMHNSVQHFNNLERAKEEINLVPVELNRLLTFWYNEKLKIEQQFESARTNLFEVNAYLFIL